MDVISPELLLMLFTATTTSLVAVAFFYLWHRLRSPRMLSFGVSFVCLGLLDYYFAIGIVVGGNPFQQQIAAAAVIVSVIFLVAGCIAHADKQTPWPVILAIGATVWVLNQIINATTGVLSFEYNPFLIGFIWFGISIFLIKYCPTRGGRILAILFLLRGVILMPWPFVLYTPTVRLIQMMDHVFIITIGLALVIFELMRARAALATANKVLRDQAQKLTEINESLDIERALAVSASNAKTAFLGGMSHELRTPLNAILGFSEIIIVAPATNIAERCADYAKDIHAAARHLLCFVDQILELSRLDTKQPDLKFEPVDVRNLVINAVEAVQQEKETSSAAQFVVQISEKIGMVECDEHLLNEALTNLLTGARKFARQDSSIQLDVVSDAEDKVRIDVIDGGLVLETEELESVFNPFFARDAAVTPIGGGMDLSLPLAKRFIELHAGRVSIQSDEMTGTVVTIILPRQRAAQLARDAFPAKAETVS